MDTITAYRQSITTWHTAWALWRQAPPRSAAAKLARANERAAWAAMKQAGHAVTLEHGIETFLAIAGEKVHATEQAA